LESSSVDSPTETLVCENCKAVNSATQKFCSRCSFPIGGTRDEQMIFRSNIAVRTRLLKESERGISTCKKLLYVLAAINLILGLVAGFMADDFSTMISSICLALLFLILTAWADRNPFGAILTAFMVYLTLNVVAIIDNPALLFQGLLFKIIFIVAFVGGIRSARQAGVHRAELEKLKGTGIGNP